MAFFAVGLRFGRAPREEKAPGPLSSVKVAEHERVLRCIWGRGEQGLLAGEAKGMPGSVGKGDRIFSEAHSYLQKLD